MVSRFPLTDYRAVYHKSALGDFVMPYEQLFSPLRINNIELPNRVVMAPMASNFADPQGGVTEELLAYYAKRVQGQPGMIISESCYVSPEGRGAVRRLGLARDDVVAGHRKFTEMVHKGNVYVCAQLHHAGSTAPMKVIGQYPVSCSSVPLLTKGEPFVGIIPKTLTESEIEDLVLAFGKAAARARDAGYDGVQIHAAHGYLLNQFLSPHTNTRTDAYGGSDSKRMKLVVDVLREVRKRVPNGFPVLCRVSGAEFHDGGYGIEFIVKLAKRLEDEGIDEISISAGNYERVDLIVPLYPHPYGCYTSLSAEVKKHVRIPVGVVGRMGKPEFAEEVLSSGKADLVYLGRELIADPLWPAKAGGKVAEEIRPCIFCNRGCFDRMMVGDDLRCAVNPWVGRDQVALDAAPPDHKRVLIVGGGPAGAQAACLAAELGFEVHLVEKSDELGGKLDVAAIPEGKDVLKDFKNYLLARLGVLGVKVHTGRPITQELADKIQPDKVIIATGAETCYPEIPGLAKDLVLTGEQVLQGAELPGCSVVVIGGGLVGIETALYLQSAGKAVTVIEIADDVLANMGSVLKKNMLVRVGEKGIRVLVSTKILEVGEGKVEVENVVGQQQIQADHVVAAIGYKPRTKDEIGDINFSAPTIVLGDASRAGMLLDISLQIQHFLLDLGFLHADRKVSQEIGQTCELV